MTDRIRVLEVALDLEAGGLEKLVADLARRIDHQRFDVHVMGLRFLGRHAEGLDQFATLHVGPPLPPWTMLWPKPLQRVITDIKPDIVHTHSGAWYKTAIAAKLAGVRGIAHTEHGRPSMNDPWTGRAIEYVASCATDVLVSVSEDLAVKMRPWVASRCAIEVILNGVDTEVFAPGDAPSPWRERLGIDQRTPVIGIVSRLDPIKDFPMLIEGLAMLRRNWPGADKPVLAIAGDGPERDNIQFLIEKFSIGDAVHQLGWVAGTAELYRLFDVFTLSSQSEGTSIALLEAMSCAVCPVVTAVGGNPNVLGPALSSLLVPSGAPSTLAERWQTVLADRATAQSFGRIARQRVLETFSLASMVRKHEALYERLANRH